MKKFVFLFIFSVPLLLLAQTDSLLQLLDASIKKRPQFARIKEWHLDSLKDLISRNTSPEQTYNLYNQLFTEYKHYNLDAALEAAKRKTAIAGQLGNRQYQYESRMNTAEIMGKMGMYKKTFDIIDSIRKGDLDPQQWRYYFHLYHSICSLLLQNALSQEEKLYYKDLIKGYKDSLLQVTDPQSLDYQLIQNGKLLEARQYNEALTLMTRCYHTPGRKEAERGAIAYGLSDVYEGMGNSEQQKKYLAIAAIADIQGAVKSYIALRKLAVLLYQEGDLERAYTYIRCCMEDAAFCKARFRMIEISEALPIIVASYDKKMKEEKESLFKYLLLISALTLVLTLCILLIYNQLKKISAAKQLIRNTNEELTVINEALKELNKKLSESDQVKETYIGYVFNLCSSYINKLENYRLTLHKKLKARQTEEALQITGSASLVTNELKEFFQNFDAVFLNIYPNFVDAFNALLKKEEQIIPKAGDILTPELRVFALMRLGVTDSSKIAGFLHYSPQTVYNYKLKIKNKLAVSKEEFAARMQQIGK